MITGIHFHSLTSTAILHRMPLFAMTSSDSILEALACFLLQRLACLGRVPFYKGLDEARTLFG